VAKPSAHIEDRLLEYREARRREARPLENRDLHAMLATVSGREPTAEGEGMWRVALEGGEVPVVYEPETGVVGMWQQLLSASDFPPDAQEQALGENARADGAYFCLQEFRSGRYLLTRLLLPEEAVDAASLAYGLEAVVELARPVTAGLSGPVVSESALEQLTAIQLEAEQGVDRAERRAQLEETLPALGLDWQRGEHEGSWTIATDAGTVRARERADGAVLGLSLALELMDVDLGDELREWMLEAGVWHGSYFSLIEDPEGGRWVDAEYRLPVRALPRPEALAFGLERVVRLGRHWVQA